MSVRKHPTKAGFWYVDIGHGASRERIPFEGSHAEALAYEASLRGTVTDHGKASLIDVYIPFMTWYEIHRLASTVKACKLAFNNQLLPTFGKTRLAHLSQINFDKYKAKRLLDGVKKRTINIELLYLRSCLSFAKEQGYDIGCVPKLFEKRQTKPDKPVVLSADELFGVIMNLSGEHQLQVMLMGMLGLRKGELHDMKRKQVDLVNSVIHVVGKGDKERIVPMPAVVLVAMAGQVDKMKQDDMVFGIADIRKAMNTAAKKAGVEKRLYPHLLRHTAGTIAAGAGIQQRTIQDLLGHSDIRTTEIYTHLAANSLKNAMSIMSTQITGK